MAKKPRNPLTDFVVYAIVRVVVCVLQALPLTVALRCGGLLGMLAYHIDKRHREVARDNLRHALPDRCADPVECDRIVRACFRHFCTMAIEIVWLPRRMHLHNWRRYATETRLGDFLRGILADRPFLIVTCHFGNWEVPGYVVGLVGFRTYAIARELDNPYLDKFLKKFRQKTGQTVLAKKGDFDQITQILAAGGAIATLGDQDAGERGLFVDFFNRPASTHKAVALLALQYEVPMVVLGVPRVGWPMKYNLEIEDLIMPEDYRGQPGAVKNLTIRFTQAIERLVRRHPEQYFWLHRRWKHQPPVKAAKKDL